MLSYSPLTLSSDRLFFDEETKKFFDRVTGDEVSGWKLADGYTVYAQINKGGSCFAYRGLHEGRFIIVKELIPASFCPFLTRREDGFIVLQDGMSYSHSYLSKIKEEVNNAYQREIDMSHRLRYKGSNNNPRFFSVNEIPISNGSLAKYLAIDTSAGDTLDTYVLSRPQYQPNSPECDIIACLKLAKEVAYAIGEIHAKGFLHLDVKPSNLFRSELTYMQDGASLIHPIDMGSAAAMLSDGHIDENVIPHGSTPEYAPIELHNAVCADSPCRRKAYAGRITKATDTYSICKMLSKWLPPENESPIPKPLKRLVYQRILDRGLSGNVKSRFQDTGSLIHALNDAVDAIERRGISCEIMALCSKELYQGITSTYKMDPRLYTTVRDEQEKPVEHIFNAVTKAHHQLIGPGGSGKTTLFYKLWGQCLESNDILPIYLNLAELSDGCADDRLKDLIISRYCGISIAGENDSIRRDRLMKILNGESENPQLFLLLLDGVQESGDPNGSLWRSELETIAACKQVRVLISSRFPLQGKLYNDWLCLFLKPIQTDSVLAVLGRQNLSAHLLELLTRPMFLAIYLQIGSYESGKLGMVKTAGELFDIYFDYLAESGRRVSRNAELVEKQHKYCIRYLLPAIAYTHGKMLVDDNSFDTSFEVCEERLANNVRLKRLFDRDEDVLRVPSSKALKIWRAKGLIRETEAGYLFSHQNYFDFAKVLYIYNEMTLAAEHAIPNCLKDDVVPLETLRMTGEVFREYRWEGKRNTTNAPSPIENWMQAHCRMEWFAPSDFGKNEHAVAQCIEMMKLVRNKDISANYSGLLLGSVDFVNCTLSGSRFDDALFDHTTFFDSAYGTYGLLTSCKNAEMHQRNLEEEWAQKHNGYNRRDFNHDYCISQDGSVVVLRNKEELFISVDGGDYETIASPSFPNHQIKRHPSLLLSPTGDRLYITSFKETYNDDGMSLDWLDKSASLLYYDVNSKAWHDTGTVLEFGSLSIEGISPDGRVIILDISPSYLADVGDSLVAFETKEFTVLYEITRESLLPLSREIGLSMFPQHPLDRPHFRSFSLSGACFYLAYDDMRLLFSSDTGKMIGLCRDVLKLGYINSINGCGDVVRLYDINDRNDIVRFDDGKEWNGVVVPNESKQYGILAGIIPEKSCTNSARLLKERVFSNHIIRIIRMVEDVIIRGVFICRYALDGSLEVEYPISAFTFNHLDGARTPRANDAAIYEIRDNEDVVEYDIEEGIICVYHLPSKTASVILELPNHPFVLPNDSIFIVHSWALSPDNSCVAFFKKIIYDRESYLKCRRSWRLEIINCDGVVAKTEFETISMDVYSARLLVLNRDDVILFIPGNKESTIIHWDGESFHEQCVKGILFFPCPQDDHIVLYIMSSSPDYFSCSLLDLHNTNSRYEFKLSREVRGGAFDGEWFDGYLERRRSREQQLGIPLMEQSPFYETVTLTFDGKTGTPLYLDKENRTLYVIDGTRNVYCGELPENGGTLFLRRYFIGVTAKDIRECHFEKAQTTPEMFRILHMNGGIVPTEFR